MSTPVLICGAECEIVALGSAPGTGGVHHWDTVNGTVALETTVVRNGGRSYKISASAGTAYLAKNLSTPNILVGHVAIRFDTLPSANALLITGSTAGSFPFIAFRASDNTIGLTSSTSLANYVSSATVSAGTWYVVEWRFNLSANPWALAMQVDGANAITLSPAIAATTMNQARIGANVDSSNTPTYAIYLDDIIASTTSGDYPLGASKVVGLYPASDGTHSFNAATDFKKNNTTNISVGATDTWTSLKTELGTTIGNFIAAAGAAAAEYLEWVFATLTESPSAIHGISVAMASHAAGTAADKQSCRVSSDGFTNFDAFAADLDQSQTTICYHSKVYAAQPGSGAAWTETAVNSMRARWGSSWVTVDISPVPFVDGLCIEVAYVPPAGTLFTQSVGGGLTPAGAVVNQTQKVLGGTVGPGGVVLNLVGHTIGGVLTPTGTPTNQTQKLLAGSLTSTGVVSASRVILLAVAGALTPSGAVALVKNFVRSLGGALTPSGVVAKQVSRLVTGTLASAGTLVRQTQKLLGGSELPAGSIVRRISQALGGSLTPAGIMSATKVALLSLGGSLLAAGAFVATFIQGTTPPPPPPPPPIVLGGDGGAARARKKNRDDEDLLTLLDDDWP